VSSDVNEIRHLLLQQMEIVIKK